MRDLGQGEVIQTSAAISPGSSGGGLFDAEGRLVGITTFYLKEGQSLNFALPAEWIAGLPERAKAEAQAAKSTRKGEFDRFLKSWGLEMQSDWQELLELSQGWIAKEPGSDYGWYLLGEAYYGLGQYDKAVSSYQKALQFKPTAGAWTNLGEAYSGLGQYDKAVTAEREAVRLQPNFRAWVDLGEAYHMLGQDDDAASAYQQAEAVLRASAAHLDELTGVAASVKASFAALDAPLWTELGVAYDGLGEHDNALEADQEAVRLDPKDADAWHDLGLDYILLQQFDKAVDAEQEAIRLKPDDEKTWLILGEAHDGLGHHDKALEADQEAVRLDPKNALAWVDLGVEYAHLGQFNRAAEAEQEAVRLDPKNALAWLDLGLDYCGQGQRDKAIEVYQSLQKLDTDQAAKLFNTCILP